MIAVREGHLETATVLLEAGADVECADETGAAAVHSAERVAGGPVAGRRHRPRGWPEGRGKRYPAGGSKTPLLYATREGSRDRAALVESDASLELADATESHRCSMRSQRKHHSCEPHGHERSLEDCESLLDAGAGVNATDWYGQTPLWAAVDVRNLELGRAAKTVAFATRPSR